MAPVSPEPTRNAILDAATALFLEHGVADTALSSIAKLAGVTKSLIHHHFETKEKLWSAVKDRLMQEYVDVQQSMLSGVDLDLPLFLKSIQVYFDFLARRPEFIRLLTMSCLENMGVEDGSENFSQSMGEDLFKLGLRAIEGAQASGTIRRDLSPGFILSTSLSMAENWFLKRAWNQHCVEDVPRSAQRANTWFSEQMMRFLERALSPN